MLIATTGSWRSSLSADKADIKARNMIKAREGHHILTRVEFSKKTEPNDPAPNNEGSMQARIFSGGSDRKSFNIILQTSPAKRHWYF